MKQSLKIFFAKVKLTILTIIGKAEDIVEKFGPVAIKFVDTIKTVNESAAGDLIELVVTKVITGNADDIAVRAAREKLKECLPEVVEKMRLIMRLSQIEDTNLQLKSIIEAIRLSDDEVQNYYYHNFAVLVLESISDRHLSMSDSIFIAEEYYKLIHKK